MRILQVGKYYTPYRGGIETVVQNLSEELVRQGHDVTALVSSHRFLPSIEWIQGVRVIRMGRLATILSQPMNPFCLFYLFFFSWRSDLIHIHSPNPILELSSIFIRKKKLVTFHAEVVRQKAFLPLYHRVQKLFFSSVDEIVVGSKPLAEKVKSLTDSGKVSIVPFGVLQKESQAEKIQVLRNRHGRFALFVGRFVSYKGIPILLSALKESPASLVLVGSGPEEQSWKQMVKNYGLENRVSFVSDVSEEDLGNYYAACELFVLPSITAAEAFGMVLLEAMSFEKPVISTKLGTGVDEVNLDQMTGIQVSPNDPVALQEAVNFLWMHPEKRAEFGRNAKERFLKFYSAKEMAKAYVNIYERIIHG